MSPEPSIGPDEPLRSGRDQTSEAADGNRGVIGFPERVETARLVLSRPTDAGLPALLAMPSDPLVRATLGGLGRGRGTHLFSLTRTAGVRKVWGCRAAHATPRVDSSTTPSTGPPRA